MALEYGDITKLAKMIGAFQQMVDKVKIDAANETVQILEYRVKKLTPVDTGNLRSKWKPEPAKLDASGRAVAKLNNPVDYAPYVEYGHRQEAGKFIPALGKRLKKSWVPGVHMLAKAEAKTNKDLPKIIDKHLRKMGFK